MSSHDGTVSDGDTPTIVTIHSLIMTASPAPQPTTSLQGPSSKEKRYDRQLRLWGAHGQEALENANVLLFNSGTGVVGIETLKNLVLPGIRSFHIVDDALVTEPDLGLNFFLDQDSLGQSRAKRCSELLQELNPDVAATWNAKVGDTQTQHLLILEMRG